MARVHSLSAQEIAVTKGFIWVGGVRDGMRLGLQETLIIMLSLVDENDKPLFPGLSRKKPEDIAEEVAHLAETMDGALHQTLYMECFRHSGYLGEENVSVEDVAKNSPETSSDSQPTT